MAIELKVPSSGESITEVQIGRWYKQEGDWADKDEAVLEIETDKASMEIVAPEAGAVSRIDKQEGEFAAVGDVVGAIDPAAKRPAADAATESKKSRAAASEPPKSESARSNGAAASNAAQASSRPASPSPAPAVEKPAAASVGPALAAGVREEDAVPMTLVRRRIAERLVSAQHNAALLTTFNEVDMSAVIALRKEHGEAFQKRHGVKLGFMSFFVKAAVDALRQFPALNAEIRGTDVVYRNYVDVGVAIGGGKGLVVPVLRNSERLSFAEIESSIADFAARAQANDLRVEELQGGTFTISNGGVYGSLLSTPIVNPPQSGVLGLHSIQERPVAERGEVVVRPMMYVALTYDHRIIDGREAVTWLRRLKEGIETPARMLLDV